MGGGRVVEDRSWPRRSVERARERTDNRLKQGKESATVAGSGGSRGQVLGEPTGMDGVNSQAKVRATVLSSCSVTERTRAEATVATAGSLEVRADRRGVRPAGPRHGQARQESDCSRHHHHPGADGSRHHRERTSREAWDGPRGTILGVSSVRKTSCAPSSPLRITDPAAHCGHREWRRPPRRLPYLPLEQPGVGRTACAVPSVRA